MVMEAAGRTVAAAGRAPREFEPPYTLIPAPEPHAFYSALKRLSDIVLSLTLLVLTLPLILLAGLAILLTTGQAPLLAQRRVGRLGREFTLLKLRTMRCKGEQAPGLHTKGPDDARITAVGRLLRRTSIDELPQLLNVLAGQMTLVGPRPALPAEVAEYRTPWLRRLAVRPGLSGLWQVSGRSSLPVERWMALDRLYVRRRSLGFDAVILLRTITAVASMRGAW